MGNHLSGESSPYLLQHADNPVDWYPWGPEALEKARLEDKPIFLSIGYSACHWCHVMAHESFEDEDVAALLNEQFVSIKVDREERPDLDAVYMQAVQALTGQGGWPLSAWLTPEGSPFFGGTYFPPTSRRGLPSFRQVLQAVAEAWSSRRADLNNAAGAVLDHLRQQMAPAAGGGATDPGPPATLDYAAILGAADQELHQSVDRRDGGWGGAPKFPQPMVLEYLLARRTVAPKAPIEFGIEITLDAMAAGGMYDHLGGGFHRYSTDGYWLVPHFEKMLYDNGQLARCYVHAWQSLGKPRYRTVAEQTLDYLLREMQHTRGGFYSAQDADTPQGEGAFFTWTSEEVRAVLSPEETAAFEQTYGLTAGPNFEGRNILHLPAGFPTPGRPEPATGDILDRGRAKLLAVRETRPRPARDEKILAGWNGLAIAALADAAAAFGAAPYREAAEKAAQFILDEMTTGGSGGTDGVGGPAGAGPAADLRLLHSWKDGRTSGDAFLDDLACVAEGFLALYRCTFDERWFLAARALMDGLLQRFSRPGGGFFDTGEDHEVLIARPRAAYDSPTPTGTSMAATVLLKIAAYTGDTHYRDRAEEALASLSHAATAAPVMAGQWLTAALLTQEEPVEAAIVGDLGHPEGQALLGAIHKVFRPLVVPAARPADVPSAVPMLLGREPGPGVVAEAWVCRHSVCSAPTADPRRFAELLAGDQPAS